MCLEFFFEQGSADGPGNGLFRPRECHKCSISRWQCRREVGWYHHIKFDKPAWQTGCVREETKRSCAAEAIAAMIDTRLPSHSSL
eukprot:5939232-Amphidinium_carterae.1